MKNRRTYTQTVKILKGGSPISIYSTVKAAVTTRQAAHFYGQRVTPNGMTLCLFHNDHTPSMKVDERFYCFACNETGDVIDYVAKLFKLSNCDAAKKLQADFCITEDAPPQPLSTRTVKRTFEGRCFLALRRYRQLLQQRKDFFAPQTVEGPFTFTYGDVDGELLYVEHLLNILLEPYGDRRDKVIGYLKEDDKISRLESYLNHFVKEVNI